jgi:hypothetical protein
MAAALCAKVARTLICQMVQLVIRIEAGVVQLPVCSVIQGVVWYSVYINAQKGKWAIQISLHGALDVGMFAIEVLKERFSFSGS